MYARCATSFVAPSFVAPSSATSGHWIDEFFKPRRSMRRQSLTLVGRQTGAILVRLCGQGFAKVCAVLPERCQTEPTDIVWITPSAATDLRAGLPDWTRALRIGGTVIVEEAARTSVSHRRALRRLLTRLGFTRVREAVGRSGRCFVARKMAVHVATLAN